MGSAPSGFQTPKTTWQSADVVDPGSFNRIEGNINAIETGSRTVDPAQAPTGNSGTLRQILDWLANRIKAILGTTNWYDNPPISLAGANAKFDGATGHKHTGAAGDAPPIPIGGIDSAAKTSAGGTEANRIAVTDSSGKVGAAKQADNAATLAGYAPGSGPNQIVQRDASGKIPGVYSSGSQVFDASGTFTVPAGVTRIWIEMWGAGGGGGGGSNVAGTWGGGGGGGSGAYLISNAVNVTPGQQITITVGAGGGGGASGNGGSGQNGGAGGASSCLGYTAGGGGGGGGDNASNSDPASGGSGGTVVAGRWGIAASVNGNAGTQGGQNGGAGASAPYGGAGGAGGTFDGSGQGINGLPGGAPGGGGGGAGGNQPSAVGGYGANGRVVIYW
ncbi:MAG: hypothetical protein IMW98_04210 [Firmicutes bacterium]|nr:hypothetical protein [Bacillota bacterium]